MNTRTKPGLRLALIACAGLASAASAQNLCFRHIGLAFGSYADHARLGDINGDGMLDVLWVDNRDLGVTLALGDRLFGETAYYDAPCCSEQFTVGDFNGDGKDDVAMASGGGGSFSFRARFAAPDGSGTLGNSIGFGANESRDRIASADLNGDGLDDVVVSGSRAEFAVYLGRSDSAFDTGDLVPLLRGASSFEIVDVDGDNDLDLVMSIRDMRRFQVALNAGDGTFPTVTEVVAGDFSPALAVGEFTGDGNVDVLAADNDDRRWQMFRGDGAGGFVRIANMPIDAQTNWLIATDLGGGAGTDLIAKTGIGSSRQLQMYLGDGAGGFVLLEEMLVPNIGAGKPALGDVTGNGEPDMVIPVDAGAAILPGRGGVPQLIPSIDNTIASEAADFNSDGVPDLVVITDGDLQVAFGLGGGLFGAPSVVATGGSFTQCAAGDFNDDGVPDVVGLVGNVVTAAINNGDGTFGTPQSIVLPTSAFSMDVGDITGDGIDDIVTASWFSSNGEIMPVISDGAGGFSLGSTLTLGANVWDVELGDISGDGVLDIVVGSRTLNAWAYFVNYGAGVFASPFVVSSSDSSSTWAIDVADFDGNGFGDVVVAMRRFDQQGSDKNAVFYNEGHGLFIESVLPDVGESVEVAAHDVDGDGMMDVAMTAGDFLAVYTNLGSRSFTSPVRYFPGPSAKALHIADLNQDGTGDYLVSTGGGYPSLAMLISMPPCGQPCVADFNSDGSVNTQDVIGFLNAWAAQDGSADINGDGSVNTRDVTAFLNLWVAGC